VKCGATGLNKFFYRYTSPITSKLVQVKIGNLPETSLADRARQETFRKDFWMLARAASRLIPAGTIVSEPLSFLSPNVRF